MELSLVPVADLEFIQSFSEKCSTLTDSLMPLHLGFYMELNFTRIHCPARKLGITPGKIKRMTEEKKKNDKKKKYRKTVSPSDCLLDSRRSISAENVPTHIDPKVDLVPPLRAEDGRGNRKMKENYNVHFVRQKKAKQNKTLEKSHLIKRVKISLAALLEHDSGLKEENIFSF